MKISVIGSGNIATFFAGKWHTAGFNIVQVYSKHLSHANILADKINAQAIDNLQDLLYDADVYFIALPDTISRNIISQLNCTNKKIVICAGSVAISEIDGSKNEIASIWPIFSINKDLLPPNDIQVPLAFTCHHTCNSDWVQLLCEKISTHFFPLNDDKKRVLHLAATMANNFTNHIYTLCYELCMQHQLDFNNLLPLIENTVYKLKYQIPSQLQTGPAIRNDEVTMAKHKELLDNPLHRKLYDIISESIINSNK